jgi:5-methylcytosine-specific restriction endonuclease McrA
VGVDVPQSTCTIEGCDSPAGVPGSAKGWCRAHYKRWYKYADPLAPMRRVYTWDGHRCEATGCDERVYAHGLCETHGARLARLGSLELPAREKRRCQFAGCSEPYYGKDLCRRHYDNARPGRGGSSRRDPEQTRQLRIERNRLHAQRRHARISGAAGDHTSEEWLARLAEFDGCCAYCGDQAEDRDHVIPLSRAGTHYIDNIVPACGHCNSSKGTQTLAEWFGFVEPERAAPRVRRHMDLIRPCSRSEVGYGQAEGSAAQQTA